MPAKKRDKILVVLPYGMCFRNIVFNEDLWGYLKSNYNIDLLSSLKIDDESKSKLGINNIYSFMPKNIFERLRRSINYRAIYYLKQMETCDFFLGQYLGVILDRNYINRNRIWKRDLLFWGALNNTAISRYIKKVLKRFPIFYHTETIIKENKYKFIIITHIAENECIIASVLANRLNIPVISITLGVDNLIFHQLLGVSDLFLLWGSCQVSEFERFQIGFNSHLRNNKYLPIGNLVYDTYLKVKSDKERFSKTYNLKHDEEVILFPALIESTLPGQRDLCEQIIEFIKKHHLKVKLLIRVRPGCDEEMWLKFQSQHNDSIVYIPRGVSYNKSIPNLSVDLDTELKEIEIFVNTIKNSALVIDPSWSTMYLDALAMGTPAVFVCYSWNKNNPAVLHPGRISFQANLVLYPKWDKINAILSKEELMSFLKKFFIEKDRSGLLSKELLESQVYSVDGKAGKRAAEAIKEFL